jgi:hypothetical protein
MGLAERLGLWILHREWKAIDKRKSFTNTLRGARKGIWTDSEQLEPIGHQHFDDQFYRLSSA